MTENDLKVIKKLASTLKRDFEVEDADSKILKCIVYNTALRELLHTITRYQKGEIDQDTIDLLMGRQ